MSQRVIGDPAEPADDPAPRVVQRLQLTPGFVGGSNIKAQVLKTCAVLNQPKLRGVDVLDIAGRSLKCVKRPLQSGVLLGCDMTGAELRDGKTNRRAQDHRAGQKRRREQHEAIALTKWGPHRGTRQQPTRRQPLRGCRSGRHYARPVEEKYLC